MVVVLLAGRVVVCVVAGALSCVVFIAAGGNVAVMNVVVHSGSTIVALTVCVTAVGAVGVVAGAVDVLVAGVDSIDMTS